MSNDLGIDRSGNGNNFTVNNLAYSDQMVDSPSNNFCTMNPLTHGSAATYEQGNLRIETPNYPWSRGTFAVSSGKWYWEWTHHDGSYPTYTGICNDSRVPAGENHGVANTQAWYGNTDGLLKDWNSSSWVNRTDLAIDDIIGIAVDLDNGSIKWYKNNTLVYTDSSLPAGEEITAMIAGTNDGTSGSGWGDITFNFGQDSSFATFKTAQGNQDGNDIGDFYYTPPTGFLALCTKNLPEPAVVPSEHFNPVLYTGTGNAQSVTGVGFQPDFVWAKKRSEAGWHHLFDAVRGAGKVLYSNATDSEDTSAQSLTSFNADGFSLGTAGGLGGDSPPINGVAWNWKANGSGSSNTDGSINTTKTSANVNAGFSIVSYTGNGSANQTVGHGLSQDIDMVIVKNRTSGSNDNWRVWHTGLSGNTYYVGLNQTSAQDTSSTVFNGHSATTFTVGNDGSVNRNTDTYIAYCFHSVDGYSKVGSYTGNGNADGIFVYTGFRPAFTLIKKSSASGSWWEMVDNKRSPTNVMSKTLYANQSDAEYNSTSYNRDFTSNGFKIRNTNAGDNTSGATYIYIAFAETPFKYSNAR